MDKQSRRSAVRDYKERRIPTGVYVVRCASSGEAWVGLSRNLHAQQNSLFFSLRLGSHVNKALQAAWREYGAEAFSYEVLEVIEDEDLTRLGRDDMLKRRERHWMDALAAAKIVG
ncbi:GIY-YIG nuclease family protein [Phenylobacterium sp.]|jgi:hypothetical protein|uniref:GIY-YIG nuclease family protein n=1 Tax=Phenylobacterium sp. TaxID=1871053 RepID=UPI002F93E2CC